MIGKVYISASFNNTLVNVCDEKGNSLCWGSSGASGFKGTRKSTPFAASSAIETVLEKAKQKGVDELEIYVKGPGPGRDSALRAIKSTGMKVSIVADVTPIPHNGPRPKKKRRV
ncbi:30S ribosomal protein S11 [Candidatus Microgenomates bacterium]|nr:30S ribosomal protein S11 [Candidatus Microgenomates bacterium]